MSDIPRENAVEVRRRLLKGALGASTVVTLGYGGAAAAQSISCLDKIATGAAFPTGTSQFTTTEPSISANDQLGWMKVEVKQYKESTGPAFDGFVLPSGASVYKIGDAANPTLPPTIVTATEHKAYDPPKFAWLLAYFHGDGTLAGVYPNITTATESPVIAPATDSCYASINPGAAPSNIVFGG